MYKLLAQNPLVRKFYPAKSEMEQMLLLSSLFSLGLGFVRVVCTRELLYLFLIWNLFLGFIPYVLSRYLMLRKRWQNNGGRFALVFVLWLLFLPNSFYIITDLFHLHERGGVPLWFDLALIFSFAWNGLLLGILSVRQMEKLLELKFRLRNEWLFVLPVMGLNALGIFIGRYWRYNSWDVVADPFRLMKDIFHLLVHPLRNHSDWGMILCFTLLLSFMYLTVKKISRAVW